MTPVRDEYKRGLGHLLSGVRARSGDAVIPSQMAAFLLLGGHVYSYSDDCSPLPVAQSVAFVKRQPFITRVLHGGRLSCTINDFTYRPPLPQFDGMHQYHLISEYEVRPIQQRRKRAKPRAGDEQSELEDLRTVSARSRV
jgi:hypothetical protein